MMIPLSTSKRRILKYAPFVAAGVILAAGVTLDVLFDAKPEEAVARPIHVVPPACDPDAVPGGTIFFWSGGQVVALEAGGDRTTALPFSPQGMPSSLVYGDDPLRDRWWLGIEDDGRLYQSNSRQQIAHRELVAYRLDPLAPDGVRRVVLTDLFGKILIANALRPQWSNDGRDAFVSFCGCDLAEALERRPDGTETLNPERVGRRRLYRMPLSGPAFHAAVQAGDWSPRTESRLEDWGSAALPVDWSPDGEAFVTYANEDEPWLLLVAPRKRLDLLDVSVADKKRPFVEFPRWSPDGRCILLKCGAGWWTTGARPGCTPQRLTEEDMLGPCVWSPDGNFVLGRRYAGSYSRIELVAWRADGTETLVLVSARRLDELGPVVDWVGNERNDGGDVTQGRL